MKTMKLGLILAALFLVLSPLKTQAAVEFRSKRFYTSSSSSTGVTAVEPAGTAQNDIVFLFLIVNGSTVTITPPTGWSTLASFATSNGVGVRIFWIRRGASAPSYALTWTATSYYELSVTSWSGVMTTGNPWDVYAISATTARTPPNPNCPAVTTTVPNTLVLAFGMTWAGWATTAGAPSGYTIAEGGVSGSFYDLAIAYKAVPIAGTEDPAAFSGTGSSTSGAVAEITVALNPAIVRVKHRVITF